jgi:hypothetical protein
LLLVSVQRRSGPIEVYERWELLRREEGEEERWWCGRRKKRRDSRA